MRKMRLLFSIIAIACAQVMAMAQKFEVENEIGNKIKYEVLSATEKTVTVTGRKDWQPQLIIPETVVYNAETYTITEVASVNPAAGYGQPLHAGPLTSVKFPTTLKKIGIGAFYGNRIQSLSLPEGLESIEYRALSADQGVSPSIYIPSSVKFIGEKAFAPYRSSKPRLCILENIPSIINENSCEEMGISKGSVTAYYAEHPRNNQPQIIYAQTTAQGGQAALVAQEQPKPFSDVDVILPETTASNENTFAIIFANENYQEEVKVDYALNDGEMFSQYCHHVLGLPEDNIHLRKDATLNNIKAEMSWMSQVAKAYKGDARFIVFYAGHGIPDEKSGVSYLLPVDGKGTMLETGYSLATFYQQLGELPAKDIAVFMDACFSGAKRGDGMLASARGVAIKAKPQAPTGKMVVFSAAQGDETAYPFKEKAHGLFTYYLLKKLQETKGNVSYQELGTYITDQVSRKSIVANGKSQTPTVVPSAGLGDSWKNLRLK